MSAAVPAFNCLWLHEVDESPCNAAYSKHEALYHHLAEYHIGRKILGTLSLQCRWRGCTHSHPFGKRDHIVSHCRAHIAVKAHFCVDCGASFKWPQDLKKHSIKKGHTGSDQGSPRSPNASESGVGSEKAATESPHITSSPFISTAFSPTAALPPKQIKLHAKRRYKRALSDDDADFEGNIQPHSKSARTLRSDSIRSLATSSLTSNTATSPPMSNSGHVSPGFRTEYEDTYPFTLQQVCSPKSNPPADCATAHIPQALLMSPVLWKMDKAEWERQWTDFQAGVFRARELQWMRSGKKGGFPSPDY